MTPVTHCRGSLFLCLSFSFPLFFPLSLPLHPFPSLSLSLWLSLSLPPLSFSIQFKKRYWHGKHMFTLPKPVHWICFLFCGQGAHSLSSLESQACLWRPFSIARLCSLSLKSNQTLFVTCICQTLFAEYNKCRPYREMLYLQALNQQCSSRRRKYLPSRLK